MLIASAALLNSAPNPRRKVTFVNMAGGKFNNHSELLRSCCREVKAIEFEKKPDGD
jgi:hypothetical protein